MLITSKSIKGCRLDRSILIFGKPLSGGFFIFSDCVIKNSIFAPMTKEQLQDLRDRVTALRRHL